MQGLELTGFFQLPPGARKYYQIFADTMLTQVRRTLEISLTQAYVQKEESGVKNEIYNISGDYEQKNISTVNQIIRLFFEKVGTVENIKELIADHVDLSFDRIGQDVRYAIDDSKLKMDFCLCLHVGNGKLFDFPTALSNT